jgi:hypothetical protein
MRQSQEEPQVHEDEERRGEPVLSRREARPWRDGAVRGVGGRITALFRKQLSHEAFSSTLHVALLLVLETLLRPVFWREATAEHYHARSIFASLASADIDSVVAAARRGVPIVPEVLILILPLLLFLFTKRRLRWTDWEHGKALRVFVMGIMIMLAWSGSTFPYNVYLDRAHLFDRGLLIVFTVLAWRYPIMLPFAARSAILLIKEVYTPIRQHDFDFRAPAEMMIIFSVFVWCSIAKSFKPKHFLCAAIGSFATYYFSAGIAKHNWGQPAHSWLLENHVSNIAVSGYVEGWAGMIPEDAFLAVVNFVAPYDVYLQFFTLVVEIGSLVGFFLHPRLTRWWFFLCFFLNFNIFLLTGICFWKYMCVSLGAFVWMGRSGKPLVARLHEYKLPLLLSIASVYWGDKFIWYMPQNNLVWWDTRLTEDYNLYVVGPSGKRYFVPSTYLAPLDFHFTQGALCPMTDKERSLSFVYATTGSYAIMRRLQDISRPEEAFEQHRRAKPCKNPKMQKVYDDFLKTYFRNLNRRGEKRYPWLSWFGRPTHLWVFPPETALGDYYAEQEPVVKVELWLTLAVYHGGKIHRTEPKLTRTLDVPPN